MKRLTALTILSSCKIMCCRLLTVQGSRISKIGNRPWAPIIRALTSSFSHNSANCKFHVLVAILLLQKS